VDLVGDDRNLTISLLAVMMVVVVVVVVGVVGVMGQPWTSASGEHAQCFLISLFFLVTKTQIKEEQVVSV
jgi:hypothetical protein